MDSQRVDMFMMNNKKYFENHQLAVVRDRISNMNDEKWPVIQTIQFKDPNISLIISLIMGQLGVDRFYIGDVGLGIAKLLTCGGLGIWTIVDWFLIMSTTRERNMEKFNAIQG